MLFGYIKDYTVKYVYRDKETNKVFISFNSLKKKDDWLNSFDSDIQDIIFKDFVFQEIKVPWYENNFELVKLVLPIVILFYIFFREL